MTLPEGDSVIKVHIATQLMTFMFLFTWCTGFVLQTSLNIVDFNLLQDLFIFHPFGIVFETGKSNPKSENQWHFNPFKTKCINIFAKNSIL